MANVARLRAKCECPSMEYRWAAVATTPKAGRTLRNRPGAARAARIRRGWTALPSSERLWR
eukprot:3063253-Pyramimonas_sp.AAC.1